MESSQKKQAQITCLRLLAASPKSRRELSRRLSEKGYPEPVVQETLDGLEKQGILNDSAYAENIVTRFTQAQPSGEKKIRFEMKRRGISARVQEEVLSNLKPGEELARAREIAQSRWQRFENLDIEKRKRRVYDFLVRRGFNYQIARDILEELT